jgi:hypothetical protein
MFGIATNERHFNEVTEVLINFEGSDGGNFETELAGDKHVQDLKPVKVVKNPDGSPAQVSVYTLLWVLTLVFRLLQCNERQGMKTLQQSGSIKSVFKIKFNPLEYSSSLKQLLKTDENNQDISMGHFEEE